VSGKTTIDEGHLSMVVEISSKDPYSESVDERHGNLLPMSQHLRRTGGD
jgi:hypothetical protein